MSLAKDLRELVASHHDANMEFARGGYRLSLNPLEDRFDELGFIIWQVGDTGMRPVVSGRAVGDELIVDQTELTGDLEERIRDLLGGEQVPLPGRGDPNAAVPTGT